MFQFLVASFRRKWARRNFQQYSHEIKSCELPRIGSVQFANWLNPLVVPRTDLREEVAFFEKVLPKGSMFIDIGRKRRTCEFGCCIGDWQNRFDTLF